MNTRGLRRVFQNGSQRERSFVLFQKVYNTPRFCGTKTRRKRKVGKEGSDVSHRARPRVETGGERLKTEGSGTSWPGGDDSISFSSFLPTEEAFREGIERTTRDSRRKGKSVSNVICGPATFLTALPVFNYLLSLLRKIYLLSFQLRFIFLPLLHTLYEKGEGCTKMEV